MPATMPAKSPESAAERFERLWQHYDDGTYCIGRDAYWPLALATAYRDMLNEAGR